MIWSLENRKIHFSKEGLNPQYGNTGCVVFKRGIQHFLPKNQYTERKLLNFEFWSLASFQKVPKFDFQISADLGKKWRRKGSTGQRFICTKVTSYKIHILGPFDFLDCIYGFGCGLLKQKEQEENIGATQSGASKGRFKALQVNAKNFFDNNRAQFYIYSWFLKPLNSQDFLLRAQNEALSQWI